MILKVLLIFDSGKLFHRKQTLARKTESARDKLFPRSQHLDWGVNIFQREVAFPVKGKNKILFTGGKLLFIF